MYGNLEFIAGIPRVWRLDLVWGLLILSVLWLIYRFLVGVFWV